MMSAWILAARPQTLSLSMTPVVVGAALAWAMERELHWPSIAAALIGSMLIQIGTNLHNDAADFKRGGDGPDRVGPPRATASGLLDGTAVNRAACACFAAAALMGAYLVWVGGWPIFLLGVLLDPFGLGLHWRSAAHRLYTARGKGSWSLFSGWAQYAAHIGCAPRKSVQPPSLAVSHWGFSPQRCCWSTITATSMPMRALAGGLWRSWRVRG